MRSSSRAYSSRTLPLPTCVASDIQSFLLGGEATETIEGAVEVGDGGVEVEHVRERGVVEMPADVGVGADELGEVAFLVPRAHRVALDEPVRIPALEPVLDEREQQPVREEEPVRRPEVPLHPLGMDDEAVDDPTE